MHELGQHTEEIRENAGMHSLQVHLSLQVLHPLGHLEQEFDDRKYPSVQVLQSTPSQV